MVSQVFRTNLTKKMLKKGKQGISMKEGLEKMAAGLPKKVPNSPDH